MQDQTANPLSLSTHHHTHTHTWGMRQGLLTCHWASRTVTSQQHPTASWTTQRSSCTLCTLCTPAAAAPPADGEPVCKHRVAFFLGGGVHARVSCACQQAPAVAAVTSRRGLSLLSSFKASDSATSVCVSSCVCVCAVRELAPPGDIASAAQKPLQFEFRNVEMQNDSYRGLQVRCR